MADFSPPGGGGGGTPGGSNGQIQYNNSGVFGADSGLTYSNGALTVGASITLGSGSDINLYRDAANTLALRNGTNNQFFNIYRTYTDPANNAYVQFAYNGFSYINNGSGPNSDLYLENLSSGGFYFATGANLRWYMTGAGHLTTVTENVDIGANGAGRPRQLFLAPSATGHASINLDPTGVAPTSPNNGDIWFDGTTLHIRIGGVTRNFTVT